MLISIDLVLAVALELGTLGARAIRWPVLPVSIAETGWGFVADRLPITVLLVGLEEGTLSVMNLPSTVKMQNPEPRVFDVLTQTCSGGLVC